MLKEILGPSPVLFMINKVGSSLSCRGGSDVLPPPNEEFVQYAEYAGKASDGKPRRMTQTELNHILSTKAKRKLSSNERLLRSVVEEAQLRRLITDKQFADLEEMYIFRRKYKNYLRMKRILPFSLVGPLTTAELSKMSYAAAIGSKSIALTIPGIIGYSLPAYFFFHMSYFYAPDKFKPICQVGKYTLGGCFMVINYLVDALAEPVEEKVFGEGVPLDINHTGGTIPSDLGTDDIHEMLKDIKSITADFSKKTF